MLNLIKVEMYKLKRSTFFYGILLFMILQAIGGPILDYRFRNKTGKEMLLFSFNIQQVLSIIILIGLFAYFVGEDFHSGCIKNLISCGHKRINILLSKSIVFYLGVIIISMSFPVILTIINTILNGYGEAFTFNSFLFVLRVILLMMLIYAAMSSIAVLFTFIFKNAPAVVGLFIGLDFVNRIAIAMSMRKESVRVIYEKTIFAQPGIAVLDKITFSQSIQIIFISLATILFSTLVGFYFFRKADIK